MKFTFQSFVALFILTIVAIGCQTREQWFTKNEGVWNVESLTVKILEDSVFVSETTKLDSLGQMEFQSSGQGYRVDFAGNKEEFTWSLNAKDDKLTLYYVAEYAEATISGQSKNGMTLNWANTAGQNGVFVTTDQTLKLKRAE